MQLDRLGDIGTDNIDSAHVTRTWQCGAVKSRLLVSCSSRYNMSSHNSAQIITVCKHILLQNFYDT